MSEFNPIPMRRIAVSPDSLLHGSCMTAECLLTLCTRKRFDAAVLPYSAETLNELRREKREGAKLILLAEGREEAARGIAAHLDIFEEVSLESEPPWRPSSRVLRLSARTLLTALRPYQWLKNALVFLPF